MPPSSANSTSGQGHSWQAGSSCRRRRPTSPGRVRDSVLVGTDFGPGSLTTPGTRGSRSAGAGGQPLSDATTLFNGEPSDVSVGAGYDHTPGFERLFISRRSTSSTANGTELRDEELIRIDVPNDAGISVHREWLLIRPRTDWWLGSAMYPAGSLLAADYDEFLSGTANLAVVFEPDEHTSLESFSWTRDRLILLTLVDVASRVEIATPGTWQRDPVAGVPPNTNTVIVDVDEYGDEIFLDSSGFDTPSRLLWGHAGDEVTEIKSAPAFFDASDLEVTQHVVSSHDGTMIPYFVVGHRDSSGPGPTLLDGYGGFENSNTPGYGGVLGRLWLAQGGVYVVANIRGGGEYGPTWHQAGPAGRTATGPTRTSPRSHATSSTRGHLRATPRRAGRQQRRAADGHHADALPGAVRCGRLPGAAARHAALPPAAGRGVLDGRVRRPGRARGVGVHARLLAVPQRSAERHYPPMLFTTSTRDDRVHPGHARKMVAAAGGSRATTCATTRTSRAATAARPTTSRRRSSPRSVTRFCGGCWTPEGELPRSQQTSMLEPCTSAPRGCAREPVRPTTPPTMPTKERALCRGPESPPVSSATFPRRTPFMRRAVSCAHRRHVSLIETHFEKARHRRRQGAQRRRRIRRDGEAQCGPASCGQGSSLTCFPRGSFRKRG